MALGEQLKAAAGPKTRRRPEDSLGDAIRRSAIRHPPSPTAPKIVAVVGDASIVNGVSFEGLNNLGLVKRQMLIVLNDNSMAIDATVGSVAKYFSRVRLSHTVRGPAPHDQEHSRTPARHRPQRRGGPREDQKEHPHGVAAEPVVRESQHSLLRPGGRPRHGVPDQAVHGRWARSTTRCCCTSTRKRARASIPADKGPTRFHSTGPFKINGDNTVDRPPRRPPAAASPTPSASR